MNSDKAIKLLGIVLAVATIIWQGGKVVGKMEDVSVSIISLSTSVKELAIEFASMRSDNADLKARLGALERTVYK